MIFKAKLTEENIGDMVLFVPNHAKDWTDESCEIGKITSWNDEFIFVKFRKKTDCMEFQETPKACKPVNLVWKTHTGIASDLGDTWMSQILYGNVTS